MPAPNVVALSKNTDKGIELFSPLAMDWRMDEDKAPIDRVNACALYMMLEEEEKERKKPTHTHKYQNQYKVEREEAREKKYLGLYVKWRDTRKVLVTRC